MPGGALAEAALLELCGDGARHDGSSPWARGRTIRKRRNRLALPHLLGSNHPDTPDSCSSAPALPAHASGCLPLFTLTRENHRPSPFVLRLLPLRSISAALLPDLPPPPAHAPRGTARALAPPLLVVVKSGRILVCCVSSSLRTHVAGLQLPRSTCSPPAIDGVGVALIFLTRIRVSTAPRVGPSLALLPLRVREPPSPLRSGPSTAARGVPSAGCSLTPSSKIQHGVPRGPLSPFRLVIGRSAPSRPPRVSLDDEIRAPSSSFLHLANRLLAPALFLAVSPATSVFVSSSMLTFHSAPGGDELIGVDDASGVSSSHRLMETKATKVFLSEEIGSECAVFRRVFVVLSKQDCGVG